MTDDEVRDVCRKLLDRSQTCDEIARLHNGVLRSVFERPSPGDDAHDRERNRHAADVLQWVAWDIRARGTQEPPQRPEAARGAAPLRPLLPTRGGER